MPVKDASPPAQVAVPVRVEPEERAVMVMVATCTPPEPSTKITLFVAFAAHRPATLAADHCPEVFTVTVVLMFQAALLMTGPGGRVFGFG